MRKQLIILFCLLALVNCRITKTSGQWVCDYCSMGKTYSDIFRQFYISLYLLRTTRRPQHLWDSNPLHVLWSSYVYCVSYTTLKGSTGGRETNFATENADFDKNGIIQLEGETSPKEDEILTVE